MSMLEYKDNRETHLITRGNVDGLVSASIFLHHEPLTRISFVTSPSAAAAVLSKDQTSRNIFVVDISPDETLLHHCEGKEVTVVDHHPCRLSKDERAEIFVKEGKSAASVLSSYLGAPESFDPLVAVADYVEYFDTPLMDEVWTEYGTKKMTREAKILDYSWRANITDDIFRYRAALRMSQGSLPSEVPMIYRRYLTVQNERRWPRAVSIVDERIQHMGDLGMLELSRRDSLLGFGTRALVHVAKRRGFRYAALFHRRENHISVSLRGLRSGGADLGVFAEDFTSRYGVSGGGHPTSAGARIPLDCSLPMMRELIALSKT
ncbi:MAG: single-stranded-DNA-specific exonuclease [Candidatus Methanomethylophilaceae archaeon]|nr:single-stranded-DNA-specific exonuclease [Candidatus Methanomethylophilaceae archaeon]